MLNKDYKEMLQLLLEEQVDFILVGAYALGAHGYPRATGDIDIWVKADEANSKKIYQTLARFGVPLDQLNENDFAVEGIIFQIGVAPRPALRLHPRGAGFYHQLRHQIPHGQGTEQRGGQQWLKII